MGINISLFTSFWESATKQKRKANGESLSNTSNDILIKLLCKNGNIRLVNINNIRKGDIIIVEAGDIIPTDGEVIEGLATVDESAITGESVPVIKEAGGDFSSVISGSRILNNYLKIRQI